MSSFPITLPFSKSFPKTCLLIKTFISSFLLFAEGFSQQNNEMDDLLKKSLDSILIQTLNGTLMRLLSKGTINLAIQMITNLPYYEKALTMFEEQLVERR